MTGCKCCFECYKHLVNRRDLIVPCADRYQCNAYIEHLEEEKKRRTGIRNEAMINIAYNSYLSGIINKEKKRK